jgi:hypothetical protein
MVSSLMRSLIGSILGFSGTETVGIAGPSQCDLAVADQAEFIICDQSIDEVFLTINGKRHVRGHRVLIYVLLRLPAVGFVAIHGYFLLDSPTCLRYKTGRLYTWLQTVWGCHGATA